LANSDSSCRELARTTNALDFFHRRLDLEKYINSLAATVARAALGWVQQEPLPCLRPPRLGKMVLVPWDLDRTLGDHWSGGFDAAQLSILLGPTRRLPAVTGWNRLQDRFFSEPTLRARFLDRLGELLEKNSSRRNSFPSSTSLNPTSVRKPQWIDAAGPARMKISIAGIAGVKSFKSNGDAPSAG